MAKLVKDLWKRFIRESEENEGEGDDREEDFYSLRKHKPQEGYESIQFQSIPRKNAQTEPTQAAMDEKTVAEPAQEEPRFTAPTAATAPKTQPASVNEPLSADVPDEDDLDGEMEEEPAFKMIAIEDIESAKRIINAVQDGYVVIADSSALDDEALASVTCYLAGAMFVLDAHILPLDDTNTVLSLTEFDPDAYLHSIGE